MTEEASLLSGCSSWLDVLQHIDNEQIKSMKTDYHHWHLSSKGALTVRYYLCYLGQLHSCESINAMLITSV